MTTIARPDERTALLPSSNDKKNDAGAIERRAGFLAEFWLLLKGSIPVVLAYTLQNSLQTVSVLIVGRSSPEDLATAAFAYMFYFVTAGVIALGGTTALDTLASCTFTGSADKRDLGILLQRAVFVLSLFYTPIALLWACSEPLFRLLGQDPVLSRDAARFLTCLIPGGLGYIYFEATKKFLQAQGMIIGHQISIFRLTFFSLYRHHASRNICSPHHNTLEWRAQLPLLLYFSNGPFGGPARYWRLLLGVLFPASSLHKCCCRIRVLGWLVTISFRCRHIHSSGFDGNHPRRHRMVGV